MIGQWQSVFLKLTFHLCELYGRLIVALDLQRALQHIDYRMKSAVLMVGRTMAFEPSARLGGDPLLKCLHQAGFSDTRFAVEQHNLAFAMPGSLPAFS